MDGVLPVDKPSGPTSHDVIAMARRALRTRRIGHTGTLDPFASGLLLLCIGVATRIAEYLGGLPKQYRATLRLGQETDTDDLTGRVLQESDAWRTISAEQLEHVLAGFRGAILQVPSAYSAKKREGVRAYRAAREGRALMLEPVPVHVARLELLSFDPPHAELEIECSSGTYVRALARDIGRALGTGGHLAALRRTAIGPHQVDAALASDQLGDEARVRAALIASVDALGDMPRIELTQDQHARIRHGQAVPILHAAGLVALVTEGELVAIGEADGERVRPRKVFVA